MPTSLAGNGVDLGAAIEVAGTFALETQRRVPDDGPSTSWSPPHLTHFSSVTTPPFSAAGQATPSA